MCYNLFTDMAWHMAEQNRKIQNTENIKGVLGTGGGLLATFFTNGCKKKVLERINPILLEDMNIAESDTDFIFVDNDDKNKKRKWALEMWRLLASHML